MLIALEHCPRPTVGRRRAGRCTVTVTDGGFTWIRFGLEVPIPLTDRALVAWGRPLGVNPTSAAQSGTRIHIEGTVPGHVIPPSDRVAGVRLAADSGPRPLRRP